MFTTAISKLDAKLLKTSQDVKLGKTQKLDDRTSKALKAFQEGSKALHPILYSQYELEKLADLKSRINKTLELAKIKTQSPSSTKNSSNVLQSIFSFITPSGNPASRQQEENVWVKNLQNISSLIEIQIKDANRSTSWIREEAQNKLRENWMKNPDIIKICFTYGDTESVIPFYFKKSFLNSSSSLYQHQFQKQLKHHLPSETSFELFTPLKTSDLSLPNEKASPYSLFCLMEFFDFLGYPERVSYFRERIEDLKSKSITDEESLQQIIKEVPFIHRLSEKIECSALKPLLENIEENAITEIVKLKFPNKEHLLKFLVDAKTNKCTHKHFLMQNYPYHDYIVLWEMNKYFSFELLIPLTTALMITIQNLCRVNSISIKSDKFNIPLSVYTQMSSTYRTLHEIGENVRNEKPEGEGRAFDGLIRFALMLAYNEANQGNQDALSFIEQKSPNLTRRQHQYGPKT